MMVCKVGLHHIDDVSPLIAKFRVTLKGYKGIQAAENIAAAREEFTECIEAGFPIYASFNEEKCIGFLVCRVASCVVWVESLFVLESSRRKGVATALYVEAENLAQSLGEETLYNYVHPNNDRMIAFLAKRGYTVLNLMEIRKPYEGEQLSECIPVRNNVFDY